MHSPHSRDAKHTISLRSMSRTSITSVPCYPATGEAMVRRLAGVQLEELMFPTQKPVREWRNPLMGGLLAHLEPVPCSPFLANTLTNTHTHACTFIQALYTNKEFHVTSLTSVNACYYQTKQNRKLNIHFLGGGNIFTIEAD